MKVINKLANWYFTKKALPNWCILAMDCALVVFSGIVAYSIVRGLPSMISVFWPLVGTYCVYLIAFLVGFRVFRTYTGVVRYSSFVDLQRITFAVLLGCGIVALSRWIFHLDEFLTPLSLPILVITFCLTTVLMWGVRVVVKYIYDVSYMSSQSDRVFIYGTKDGGVGIAKNIRNQASSNYTLRGFVTNDPTMYGKTLMAVPVYRDDENLVSIMRQKRIKTLLVSPLQSDYFRNREDLINQLLDAKIHIMMYPAAQEWDGHSDISLTSLREVAVEDLLPREKIEVDMDEIGGMLSGKKILITGAAGSIGSEIVRQVSSFKPAELVLIDAAETPLHDIRLMMARRWPEIPARTLVSSICNKTRMEDVFKTHKPDYVFHAAAYKHVPMMEDNPSESIQNNVEGTRVVADLAVKYGAKKFVMVSTDKAVNPTNVMGCSKRLCEIYCQSLNKAIQEGEVKGVTQFVTTRFGNVLGSNGSVIPLFREQIMNGGPVTVTHPDIIRFFMLIPEACKLVLEAGTMGKGGEIYVFDMGKPVKIADLAKRMIALSGATNIKVVYTGLRDGEKLYEELLDDAEITQPTHHPKIKIATVREYDYSEVCKQFDDLARLSEGYDDMGIVKVMKEIVPEFKSKHSKYEELDN